MYLHIRIAQPEQDWSPPLAHVGERFVWWQDEHTTLCLPGQCSCVGQSEPLGAEQNPVAKPQPPLPSSGPLGK